MHHTKKGNMWNFGMKIDIYVYARTGLMHSFEMTAANEHTLNQADLILHGEEQFVLLVQAIEEKVSGRTLKTKQLTVT